METKTMYQCERCGELYHNDKNAEMCEDRHYFVNYVKPIYEKGNPMPKAIDIEFVNALGQTTDRRFWLGYK